jgi:hypothetical protein
MLIVPLLMVQSNYDEKPGIRTSTFKYFIRKRDYLIARKDILAYNGNEPYYELRTYMNPKLNVDNFQQYMVHE